MRKLPPLIKGYLRVGAMVGDGAVIDEPFNTVDVFMVMPVASISASPGRVGATTLTDPNGSGKSFVQYLNTGDYAGVTITGATFGSGSEVGFDWVGKPYNSSSTALTAAGTVTLSAGSYTVTVQPTTGLSKVTP